MNYPESQKILEEIKKAKRILVNCHRSPDPDGIASALAVYYVLTRFGKDIRVISPDGITSDCLFLISSEKIEKTDFNKFDFCKYDLLIIVDAGNWDQVTGRENIESSKIKTIVIDHHFTNPGYGVINLVDKKASSICEMLFRIFEDWGVELSKELSTILLTGIITDTVCFQADGLNSEVFKTSGELMDIGADKNLIIFNLYKSQSIEKLKLMGRILEKMQIDGDYNFVWSAISKSESKKYLNSQDAKSIAASLFAGSVKDTNFGIFMIEAEDSLSLSLRSRTGFDVSPIAEELGGGGHKTAAGAKIVGLSFDKAVEKVLEVARKHAKRN